MVLEVINYFETPREPLPMNYLAQGVLGKGSIIAAINPRATEEVIRGILRAAKKTRSVVIMELALSEMDLSGGYTGYTPLKFAKRVRSAAEKEKWFAYSLHADHVTVKKGTPEEMDKVKKEIVARVESGFTGYAIDTSYLYNTEADTVPEQLADIIEKGIVLFDFLKEQMGDRVYGLEGEIGEITGGSEYSTPEEAVHYLNALTGHGVNIDYLAIANGSKHGVTVDAEGKVIPQLGINLQVTSDTINALEKEGYTTCRIAQHGITGTPVDVIAKMFPHGDISKGNIGTFWQILVFSELEKHEPALYGRMREWVLEKYSKEGVDEHKTFSANSKFAWKEFYDEVEAIGAEAKEAILTRAEKDMIAFIDALNMTSSAEHVHKYIHERKLEDTY